MIKPEKIEAQPDIARFQRALNDGQSSPHSYVILLGSQPLETTDLISQVDVGFSYEEVEHFRQNIRLSLAELSELIQIKPRTLSRRKKESRLEPAESDRLLRASRVFGRALELFEGNPDATHRWLNAPLTALNGVTPLSLIRTEVGAREVENLIGRLEYGVFS